MTLLLRMGIQLGKAEGINEGKIMGKLERNIEIAKAMVLKGYPLDDIITLTGLSIKEVNQIKQVD